LFEQLPKEKTSILGTAELSLADLVYKSLEYKNDTFNEGGETDEKLMIVGCPDNNNVNQEGQGSQDLAASIDEIELNNTLTINKPRDISSYLTITKTAQINYLNPRLLPAAKADDDLAKLPEFTVEATISNFLIDPEIIEHGNFINLHLNDIYPVPDEWSLKEGTEKDLNSSKN